MNHQHPACIPRTTPKDNQIGWQTNRLGCVNHQLEDESHETDHYLGNQISNVNGIVIQEISSLFITMNRLTLIPHRNLNTNMEEQRPTGIPRTTTVNLKGNKKVRFPPSQIGRDGELT